MHWSGPMKAMFGVVSLLIALAIVGFLAARQLRTAAPSASSAATAAAAATAGVVLPDVSASATVREQSQQIQQKVKDDVAKALQQGAAPRKDTSDQ
jgi:metal-dependent amidase/aminoacylase/carboxypeptidase family protein